MLENGFVKLHRSLCKWRWFKNHKTLALFLYFLLQANYEPSEFEALTVKRGQLVTSYPALAENLGMTVQSVRTAIKHLKLTGEITVISYPKYSVITVVNYNRYQGEQLSSNSQSTVKQQSNGNNERKYKKEKKDNNAKKDSRANVLLTNSQFEELSEMSCRTVVEKYLDKLVCWEKRTGNKCRNPYLEIKSWIEQDKIHSKTSAKQNSGTSYDINELERFAMDYVPKLGGSNDTA